MDRNTIIYFGGFELPDKNAAAQRVISISKSLRDIGHKIIIVGLCKGLSEQDGLVKCNYNLRGIEMMERAYPKSVKQWMNHILSCKKEVEIIKKTPKVKTIICYNYPSIALWKLNKFCISKNIKVIADVTEWYPPSRKKFPLNLIKDIDTNLRMKYIQPKLNSIICISKFLYNYYESKVPNCIFVPGTIDKADKKWIQAIEYIPNTPFTLGYAGNPGVKCEKERIDLLIKAVCQLNVEGYPCHLKIAGFEQNSFELDYSQIVNHVYYKECIHYLGRISHKECIQLITSVDYSVLIREDTRVTRAGFPTKLSESFACGTPVITTPSSNVTEFIIEGKNGLVTKDFSYESLIETIKKAITSNQDAMKIMHSWVRKNNKLEYEKYTGVIEELINRDNF